MKKSVPPRPGEQRAHKGAPKVVLWASDPTKVALKAVQNPDHEAKICSLATPRKHTQTPAFISERANVQIRDPRSQKDYAGFPQNVILVERGFEKLQN